MPVNGIQIIILTIFLSIIIRFNAAAQDSLVINDTLNVSVQSDTSAENRVTKSNFVKKRQLVFAKVKCGGKSFLIASPKGWVLDDKSGRDQGLEVVLYPEGWNLDYAPVLMYTKVITKNGSGDKSFTEIVSEQIDQLKNYGAAILKDSIAYTYDNKQSVIINFIDKNTQTNNLVSYINEYNYVVSMILTSRDKELFLKSKPKFFELVNSYKIN
jgi:hypothetical protein